MKQIQTLLLLVAALIFLSAGAPVMAADKAATPAISDETLALQGQVLAERVEKLQAQYSLTLQELQRVRGELAKRAEAKKAEKGKEGKK